MRPNYHPTDGKHPPREKTASLGDFSYRLYWTSLSTRAEGEGAEVSAGCVIPSDGLSLMDDPNCLFSSACGMDRAAEGTSDWVTLSNDTEHSIEVWYTSRAYPWRPPGGQAGRPGQTIRKTVLRLC